MPDTAAGDRPLFIVGAHRSGTTLLRCMLCAGGRVFIPPESDFIPRFFRRGGMVTRRRAEAVLWALAREHRYRLFARDWKPAVPSARELLGDADRVEAGVFIARLFDHYARGYGAVRWGDKTPIYTSHVALLSRLLPEARFVHLIRDGRDVAMSTVERWGGREWHTDPYVAIRNWGRRVRAARRAGARLGPERYTEVRYEALVHESEPTLRGLCQFLGEPFDAAMTQPSRAASEWFEKDNPFHHRLHQPVNPRRCGRWWREMSDADQRLCESAEGRLLARLGYPLRWPSDSGSRYDAARRGALELKYRLFRGVRESLAVARLMPPG